jgi:hypothetical protein
MMNQIEVIPIFQNKNREKTNPTEVTVKRIKLIKLLMKSIKTKEKLSSQQRGDHHKP